MLVTGLAKVPGIHETVNQAMRRLGKCIVICAASVLSRLVDREARALA